MCWTAEEEQQEETLATIHVMRRQEEIYLPEDYLHCIDDEEDENPFSAFKPINEHWRSTMVQWCYTVSDHFDLNRDTIAIAMNNFDRFMSFITTETFDNNDRINNSNKFGHQEGVMYYQLVLMVCLYIAVKIHEPVAMEPSIISMMSKGRYSEQEVIEMERTVIDNIRWRLNPPTPMSFVHYFLQLFPSEIIDPSEIEEFRKFWELTAQQIELGVKDYLFVGSYASCTALAAMTNAIQAVKTDNNYSTNHKVLTRKLRKITSKIIVKNNMCAEDFVLYQDCLWNLVKDQQQKNQARIPHNTEHKPQKTITASNEESLSFKLHGSPRGISSAFPQS